MDIINKLIIRYAIPNSEISITKTELRHKKFHQARKLKTCEILEITHLRELQIFGCSLLELGISVLQVGVLAQDFLDVVFNLGEQINKLDVRRQQQRPGGGRTKMVL